MANIPPPPPPNPSPQWSAPPPPPSTPKSVPPPHPALVEAKPAWMPPTPAAKEPEKVVAQIPTKPTEPAAPFVPPPASKQQPSPAATTAPSTGRNGLLIGSVIGVVVVIGVGVFLAMRHKSSSPQPSAQQTEATERVAATTAQPAPAPATSTRTATENPPAQPAQSTPQVLSSGLKLRQIGLALNLYGADHNGKMPDSLADLAPTYLTSDILLETETSKPFVYRGTGKDATTPNTDVMAYSSAVAGKSYGVLKNGAVVMMTPERLAQANAEPPKAIQPKAAPAAAPSVEPIAVAPTPVEPVKDTRTAIWSKPPPTASAPTPAQTPAAPTPPEVKWLDPATLVADCMQIDRDANNAIKPKVKEGAFDKSYRSKRIKYSGTIDSIKKGDSVVNFKSAGKWPNNYHVQANFSSDKSTLLNSLKKGQQLTIEGSLAGFAMPLVDAGMTGVFGPSRSITVNEVKVIDE